MKISIRAVCFTIFCVAFLIVILRFIFIHDDELDYKTALLAIPHPKNNLILINLSTRSDHLAELDELIQPYMNQTKDIFDIKTLGPCTPENMFGYLENKPCVFLQLHNSAFWTPEPYFISTSANSTLIKFPHEVPTYIREYVKGIMSWNVTDSINSVYLSCDDQYSNEPENTQIYEFFPDRKIENDRFGANSMLAPIVAIRFPGVEKNKKLDVTCNAWARNSNLLLDGGVLKFTILFS